MNSPSALGVSSFRGGPLRAEDEVRRHHWISFLTIWQNLSVHGRFLGVLEDLPLENKENRERY
ncbi:MAG: hypothetical protein JWP89_5544 [Schlesneria sp.]|nr:hypothetical protein [Schlesneria sp.]